MAPVRLTAFAKATAVRRSFSGGGSRTLPPHRMFGGDVVLALHEGRVRAERLIGLIRLPCGRSLREGVDRLPRGAMRRRFLGAGGRTKPALQIVDRCGAAF